MSFWRFLSIIDLMKVIFKTFQKPKHLKKITWKNSIYFTADNKNFNELMSFNEDVASGFLTVFIIYTWYKLILSQLKEFKLLKRLYFCIDRSSE